MDLLQKNEKKIKKIRNSVIAAPMWHGNLLLLHNITYQSMSVGKVRDYAVAGA